MMTAALESFEGEGEKVFNAFKKSLEIENVIVKFGGVTVANQNVINNDLTFSDAWIPIINKLNILISNASFQGEISKKTPLKALVGKGEISFEITGEINNRKVTDTYTFNLSISKII